MSEDTILIVGLGNPGKDYRNNRHNVGYMLADALAKNLGLTFARRKGNARIAEGNLEGRKLILAKPITFMNNSGKSVGALARYFRILPANILVIYDDLDLPFSALRLRPGGGSAGHKGMRSIIAHLNTNEFPRLRIGIDRPPGRMDPADYVLQNFSIAQNAELEAVLDRALQCVRVFILEGIQAAMTGFNPVDSV
jgi:PTH1 family peptidyl-tRNA hydrolase